MSMIKEHMKNLLKLRDLAKQRQDAEGKVRDGRRKAAANNERKNGGL
jgi:hypothetical protein